ncbi:MAG: glycosyltransferase [Anaerolineae bacterium]
MIERPLITFAVIAYNAEKYIREAVEGAFTQTYSPLQIVLSDDGSADATFQIMEEMANAYHGPHTVLLNRNARNLGIGAHINRIMELAHGKYVIIAAGDDVSLPHRTERIYQEFVDGGSETMVVFSDMIEIDSTGTILRKSNYHPPVGFDDPVQCCQNMLRGITGASNAWNRKLFDIFGPLLPEVTFEDRVIALRAALLGDIRYIQEPLVKYRLHATNTVAMFHNNQHEEARRVLECFLWSYRNAAQDLDIFIRKVQPAFPEATRCQRIVKRRIHKLEAYLQIYGGVPKDVGQGLLRLILNGGNPLGGLKAYSRVRQGKTSFAEQQAKSNSPDCAHPIEACK